MEDKKHASEKVAWGEGEWRGALTFSLSHLPAFLCKKRLNFIIIFVIATLFTSCTKVINVSLPNSVQQLVVDGSIMNGVPPIILLTKSQKLFSNVNLNQLANYLVHGATISITGSDGSHVTLQEFCLQGLNLTAAEQQQLLYKFGLAYADSAYVADICVYTVPDIFTYVNGGQSSFEGKERTTYNLSIVAPPLYGKDSARVTASTTIPTAIGLDSLAIQPYPNASLQDSLAAVLAYFSSPDTFGNFIIYETQINNQPFYQPPGGSAYNEMLFAGKTIGLPLQRGAPPTANLDINTANYFDRGDTVTVMWSNIDNNTYNFFFTIENQGSGNPFSEPVVVQSNINNGLGIWAGYATKYYTIVVPKL